MNIEAKDIVSIYGVSKNTEGIITINILKQNGNKFTHVQLNLSKKNWDEISKIVNNIINNDIRNMTEEERLTYHERDCDIQNMIQPPDPPVYPEPCKTLWSRFIHWINQY